VSPQLRSTLPKLSQAFAALGKRARFLEELIPAAVSAQLVIRQTRSHSATSSYTVNYDAYSVSEKGVALLSNPSARVMVRAPQGVLDLERKEVERVANLKKELTEGGVNLSHIPASEIEAGEGPILKAEQQWVRKINSLRGGDEQSVKKAEALCAFLDAILKWRSRVAMENLLAPHHIMAEHVAKAIVYSQPKCLESLKQCGVRVQPEGLLNVILEQLETLGLTNKTPSDDTISSTNDKIIELPSGNYVPVEKWEYAVYKVGPKGKTPAWETYWKRFQKGEHPEAIAMTPESGKPVQVTTVINNILTGLLHKRPVNLQRLAEINPLPTESIWLRLQEVSTTNNLNPRAEDFKAKDMLREIIGLKVDMDFKEKTEVQKQEENMWYNHVRYWQHLTIAGFKPNFISSESSKKARVE